MKTPIIGKTYFHRRKKNAPPIEVVAVDTESSTVTLKAHMFCTGTELIIPPDGTITHPIDRFWKIWNELPKV